MEHSASQSTSTGLTHESFERLLAWLDPDRERAGQRYEEIRFQLIKIFTSRGCLICEELADETINRVARRIDEVAESYQGDPALYFYGVARMIYLEYLRRKPVVLPLQVSSPSDPSEENERKYECLEQCMKRLTPKNRELILSYYAEEKQAKVDHRKVLAERMGLEPNALWVRMHRIREKLRECVSECLRQED